MVNPQGVVGKLARFEIPQNVRYMGAFPMAATRKIRKFRMPEIEIPELGFDRGRLRPCRMMP